VQTVIEHCMTAFWAVFCVSLFMLMFGTFVVAMSFMNILSDNDKSLKHLCIALIIISASIMIWILSFL
jgi:divalent metal cation (Fe/Co/Zn/Cd) transporter